MDVVCGKSKRRVNALYMGAPRDGSDATDAAPRRDTQTETAPRAISLRILQKQATRSVRSGYGPHVSLFVAIAAEQKLRCMRVSSGDLPGRVS
jgi:hypothetical protein